MSRLLQTAIVLLTMCCPAAWAQSAVLRLVGRIELQGTSGRLDHLAYAPEQNLLFVAAVAADKVDVVDLNTGTRVRQITGMREPQGLAYAQGGGRLFVASGAGARLDAFDGDRRVPILGDLPDADNVRYDAESGHVFVGYDGGLAEVDARSGALKQRSAVPGHPEAFEVASSRIFVNVPSAGAVIVLDRRSGAQLAAWDVGPARGNFPMALDQASHRLFVATRRPPLLEVYDTQTGKRRQEIPACADADDLFLDRDHDALLAVCGQGQLLVFDIGARVPVHVRQRLATTPGARTGLLVRSLGRSFVAAPAGAGRKAAILVFAWER